MSKKSLTHSPVASTLNYRRRVLQPVGDASLTQTEFQDDCDINHQIAQYQRHRLPLPTHWQSVPVDQVQDIHATYIDVINSVREVDEAFADLPAKVRSRFDNDPLKLAQFLADPANHSEAYDLGLVQSAPESLTPAEQNPSPADAGDAQPPKGGG